jgi:dipeptidyl-peptidase-4
MAARWSSMPRSCSSVETRWYATARVYTERLIGLPEDNPAGFKAAALTSVAGRLSGKVMLIHGTLDENVHLQ